MKNKNLDLLIKFLKIKSVSAQKEYAPEMKKARLFLVEIFKKNGFKTRILKGDVHNLVYAEKIIDPKKPTVLIYGHYDVQPPEPIEEWITPPFSPTIKNGNIFGRGTSDDKGQIMANIAAGFGKTFINLKYIVEGEEEIGSTSVEKIAEKYGKTLLKCDYMIVSDSEMLENGTPTIDVNLRGLTYMDVSIKSAVHDLHSGSYGGVAENPAIVLAGIIAKLKNKSGRILIPGFYDNISSLSASERKDFESVPVSKKSLMKEGEFYVIGGGEKRYSLNLRRWARPTLDVNGLTSGYQGDGAKTIIPGKASAKISMRLVPNQDPKDIAIKFTKYVRSLVPKGMILEISDFSDSLPYKAPTMDPIFNVVKASLSRAFGKKAIYDGVGGTIGFVPIVAKKLGVPCLLIGFGKPSDNIHAPNEHILIDNYLKGIDAISDLLKTIGENNVK